MNPGGGKARKFVYALLLIVFVFLVVEAFSRVEWSLRSEVPFFSPNVHFYYPELRRISEPADRDEKGVRVLLLGGSVLHEDWGNIPRVLEERLSRAFRREVWIENLAMPGHTSLDSYYKYRRLSRESFDLVVLYHGINELRLNNCPSGVFRADYGHYSWYRVINRFEAHPGLPNCATLYSLTYRFFRLDEKLISPENYIPRDRPEEEMTAFGGEVKTVGPFETNFTRILDLAREKGEPVLLMKFSYYLAPGYTLEKFEDRALDYCLHSCPVEIWGAPLHILAGLEAHNGIIEELARTHAGSVLFVDQQRAMPKDGEHFNDICHLSQKGSGVFVENIMRALPAGVFAD